MASVSNDGAKDRWRVTFDLDGRRKTVRLGKVTKRVAEGTKLRIEAIIACRQADHPLDTDTSTWLGKIGDDLHDKLARAGLVRERGRGTVGGFLDAHMAARAADSKGGSLVNLRIVANDLAAALRPATLLRSVGVAEAERYRTLLLTRTAPKLAPATASRRLKVAKQFFAAAHREGLIERNPFADVSLPSGQTGGRRVYVPAASALKAAEGAPLRWRLVIALARLAGLRCPSEPLLVRWDEVDFARGRLVVHSPKTEHFPGKAARVIPIFPALLPFLREAEAAREEGAVYVVPADRWRQVAAGPKGWRAVSLGAGVSRLVRRAGLTPWPKPLQNLRASFETDLMERHPIQVVTAWMGHTPAVALTSYLSVREEDFSRAIGGGTETGTVSDAQGVSGVDIRTEGQGEKHP